ncbi:MAG: HAMP domain-containing protein [Clostridia bacterium]|nr:HAMP domain-containing protein [Clostridia bacterium]
MRSSLFWRAFAAFMALTLCTVALCTAAVAAFMQAERQGVYENEVRQQAYEVADYMAHLNALNFVRENTTMQYVIRSKINKIREIYGAEIWIANYSSGIVQYLDGEWNTSEAITTEAVFEQLSIIQSGREIRVQGLFPNLGQEIVTIGVPWRYSDGYVVGAVLLHISVESLEVSYTELLVKIMPISSVALMLGIVLSYVLARSQSRPVKQISVAVKQFAEGDLTSRVQLDCGGELQTLGDSINDMAQALSELEDSRRSFVANVSHELRSPLTSMRGYVEGMLDGTIPEEEYGKYLSVVRDETRRLTTLVNDLLNLSRIESGKFPMNKVGYDICEQLRRILIGFEGRIDERCSDVQVNMPEEQLMVMADPDRINQVISNLIDNALKFMPEEGGVLGLVISREGEKVHVSVSDNGTGIPEEDIGHVFDRFYKADKAHTSGMGTGLGLAIAKSILDQHGGRITARSGGGETVFEFWIDAA